MSLTQSLVITFLLIALNAFFSAAEIALAASRRVRLRQLASAGDKRAETVAQVQAQPGDYFTVVQIAQNAVAILGGIVGESAFSPYLTVLLSVWMEPVWAARLAFVLSFTLVTSLFLVLADLMPRRAGMAEPELVAMRVVGPMALLTRLFRPVVWFYATLTNGLLKLTGVPAARDDSITSDDILALTEAGTQAGVLALPEQRVIENLFELDTRWVSSAMTPRDRIAWFSQDEPEETLKARIAAEPFSTYPVCDGEIDRVLGYVDAKELFQRVLTRQPISLRDPTLLHKALVVPDRLSLAEVLTQFRQAQEDFAIIVNEYSLVVGIITLNDVMSTVMGELVTYDDEELIVRRDDGSWLIDGVTPISDVARAIGVSDWPHDDEYETLAGFLMVMLRRVPKRTDVVRWSGHRFEVLDVDSFRIDQVMVSKEVSGQNSDHSNGN
jgi:CBS domain containing-hemolysin-like protein